MKTTSFALFFIIQTISIMAQDNLFWAGTWEGALDVQGQKLRIVFHLKAAPNGQWNAMMDSPDQNAFDIPISSATTQAEESISLKLDNLKASYTGKYDALSKSVIGTWTQGVGSLPLTITKGATVKKPNRPQTPQPPFSYWSEDLQFPNKKANNIKLAGTLTLPSKEGKNYPAVILISGSGAQDRDETIMGHKPFLVIADYLTKQGFAVLRFDDRGYAKSEGDLMNATTADFVTDALAAVEYLKTRPEINHKKIGIMGHSEGGAVAPMAAAKNKSVAFVVMLAGLGVTMEQIVLQQLVDISVAGGMDKSLAEKNAALSKKIYEVIKKDTKKTMTATDVWKAVEPDLQKIFTKEEQTALGFSEAAMVKQLAGALSPWFRYALTIDPTQYLPKVKCPLLALNGEKDLQVAAVANLEGVRKCLEKGKNKNFTCELIPNLNHLFQHCEKGTIDEYSTIEETFSEDALQTISDWLKGICK